MGERERERNKQTLEWMLSYASKTMIQIIQCGGIKVGVGGRWAGWAVGVRQSDGQMTSELHLQCAEGFNMRVEHLNSRPV